MKKNNFLDTWESHDTKDSTKIVRLYYFILIIVIVILVLKVVKSCRFEISIVLTIFIVSVF